MNAVLWMKSSCATCRNAGAIALILQDNNLLKRPLLVHPKGTVIGYDADAYARLAGGT